MNHTCLQIQSLKGIPTEFVLGFEPKLSQSCIQISVLMSASLLFFINEEMTLSWLYGSDMIHTLISTEVSGNAGIHVHLLFYKTVYSNVLLLLHAAFCILYCREIYANLNRAQSCFTSHTI